MWLHRCRQGVAARQTSTGGSPNSGPVGAAGASLDLDALLLQLLGRRPNGLEPGRFDLALAVTIQLVYKAFVSVLPSRSSPVQPERETAGSPIDAGGSGRGTPLWLLFTNRLSECSENPGDPVGPSEGRHDRLVEHEYFEGAPRTLGVPAATQLAEA